MPGVFDPLRIPPDEQVREMAQGLRDDGFAAVQRSLAHAIETRFVRHHLDKHIVAPRAGHQDLDFGYLHRVSSVTALISTGMRGAGAAGSAGCPTFSSLAADSGVMRGNVTTTRAPPSV